jgi:hypothetical protein
MTEPTVSEILACVFGSDFSGATQAQRLLLLEAVTLVLRTGGAWSNKLRFVCSRTKAPKIPEDCFPFVEITTNEGLKLLAILNVAIVEGYSVLFASEQSQQKEIVVQDDD